MKNKERIIWIGSLVIILAVSLFVVLHYHTKLSNTEQKMISLTKDNTKLQQENGDYATQVAGLTGEIEKLKLVNYDKATLEFEHKGYTGQLKDIVADLKLHAS